MKRALLIGIDHYEINGLGTCEEDARRLGELLSRHGSGSRSRLKNFDVDVLLSEVDGPVTRLVMLDAVKALLRDQAEVALLYFAGHGVFDYSTENAVLVAQDGEDMQTGISLSEITALAAVGADQAFLEEIGELTKLEQLDIRYPFRANDLSPLRKLRNLRVLHLESAGQVSDFSPLAELPLLEVLTIEHAKHLFELDWLLPLKDRLITLGLEGSISTDQRILSLKPLEGFALEALFMVSATLKDKSLSPLATCPNLILFDSARLAPRSEFQALEAAKPELLCPWFADWGWVKHR